MNTKKIFLIFFASVIALLLLAKWDDLYFEKKQRMETGEKIWKNLSSNKVQSFFLEDLDKKISLRTSRQEWEKPWELIDYPGEKADSEEIKRILDLLLSVEIKKKITQDPKTYQHYRITPPRRKITLKTFFGKEHTLFIGEVAQVGYGLYIKKSGDPGVYLVSRYLDLITNKKLFDWQKKNFMNISNDFEELKVLRQGYDTISLSPPKKPVTYIKELNEIEAIDTLPMDPRFHKTKWLYEVSWKNPESPKRQVRFVFIDLDMYAYEEPGGTLLYKVPLGQTTHLLARLTKEASMMK